MLYSITASKLKKTLMIQAYVTIHEKNWAVKFEYILCRNICGNFEEKRIFLMGD